MRTAPTVKQHLACIRMLFDWLVTGQVIADESRACRPGAASLGHAKARPR